MTPSTVSRPAAVSPQSRPRSRRGEGGRLRGEILKAAVGLIAQTGDAAALSIRTLSAEVGVTPPSIYRHFTDKAAILRAVLEEQFADFAECLDRASERSRSPFTALRRRSEAYLRFAEQEPGSYRVLFSAAALGPAKIGLTDGPHPGASSFFALVESVQRCMEAGARPGGDASFVAIMLWSTLHGFADLRIGKPEMPWPDADRVVRDLLRRMRLDQPARHKR